jgi:hypothetical protein
MVRPAPLILMLQLTNRDQRIMVTCSAPPGAPAHQPGSKEGAMVQIKLQRSGSSIAKGVPKNFPTRLCATCSVAGMSKACSELCGHLAIH